MGAGVHASAEGLIRMSDEIQGTPPEAPPPPADVPPPPPAAPPIAGGEGPSETGKILAAVGYIIGIVALIAILIEPYKNERFVRHHAVQALGLWVAGFVIGIVGQIPFVGWLVAVVGGIALFVVAIMGAIKSFQGEWWEVPLIYPIVKQYI